MLEAVEVEVCLLEVLEVMHCVLLCMLEAVEGGFCLLEVPDVMRCVLLCMLEAVEGGLCLLGLLEVLEVLEVPEMWHQATRFEGHILCLGMSVKITPIGLPRV